MILPPLGGGEFVSRYEVIRSRMTPVIIFQILWFDSTVSAGITHEPRKASVTCLEPWYWLLAGAAILQVAFPMWCCPPGLSTWPPQDSLHFLTSWWLWSCPAI